VNYVAITGVSNVTGIINPVHEIAELAHAHGALLLVDGAQMVAHLPVQVSGHSPAGRDIDVLVFSGHKIYAPGSPGVVVARKDLLSGLEPQVVGGGMVDRVYLNRYSITERFPDREEAGTPNITGAIALAAALGALRRVGMDLVAEEETRLIEYALGRLQKVPDVVVYGETDCTRCKRTGAISFNIKGLDHALTAAVLNDYFNIAVRNECFCAHPYVREMITLSLTEEELTDDELEELADLHNGMVRASFGIYSTEADVDALTAALGRICAEKDSFQQRYRRLPNGDYEHESFVFRPEEIFSVAKALDESLGL
jgi:selenocysteine lyase/cysteine desulfurase